MCTLTFCLPGATPKKADLVRSCQANPDGFGFAIATKDGMIIGKDMNAQKTIKWFLRERHAHPASCAIFHSRIGTHGSKDVSNCHPFFVDEREMTVIAHNGVLKVYADKEDTRSDTRIFAEDYFPKFGGLPAISDYQMRNLIEDWMGYGNKVVVMTIDPEVEWDYAILNEGGTSAHWSDDKRIWWSNRSYKERKTFTYSNVHGLTPRYNAHLGQGYVDGKWIDKGNPYEQMQLGKIWVSSKGWCLPSEAKTEYEVDAWEKRVKKLTIDEWEMLKRTPDLNEKPGTISTRWVDGVMTTRTYKKSLDGLWRWYDRDNKLVGEEDWGKLPPPKDPMGLNKESEEVVIEVETEVETETETEEDEDDDDDGEVMVINCKLCGADLTKQQFPDWCNMCWTCQFCEEAIHDCRCRIGKDRWDDYLWAE